MNALSVLYICKGIPWDDNYKHVRLFESAEAANSFILSKQAFNYTEFSFISKDGRTSVAVPGFSEQYRDCNYIAFLNSGYSTKWIYAFIQNVNYIADGTALIEYVEDYFTTWFYNCTLKPCFVEREHVTDDTIGENTVPENIVMGDPVNVGGSNKQYVHTWYMYVSQLAPGVEDMGLTILNPGDDGNKTSGFYKIRLGDLGNTMDTLIKLYTHKGMLEAINSVFALTDVENIGGPITFAPVDTFGGYAPKNNKLLCYPYNYMTIVMAGSEIAYRYEYFTDRSPSFQLKQPLYPGGASYIFPIGYQQGVGNDVFNLENSVTTGAYPTASFGASQFQNYLAQQGPSIAIGLIGDIGSIVGGAYAASPEAITGGVTGIANTVADLYKHALVSQTVKGTQSVSNLAYEEYIFVRLKNMQIRPEYAKIIDDYLSAFGYKVCRIKQPNITGRSSWNFVKTIDCVIDGNAPDYAIKNIRTLFDRGVTLWHNNDVGNYELNNSITGG